MTMISTGRPSGAMARLSAGLSMTARMLRRSGRRQRLRLAAGARDLARPCPLTLVVVGTTLAASLLFLAAPGIDLAASAAFHEPGAGFPAASLEALRLLRRSSTWVMGAVLILTLAVAFGPRSWRIVGRESRRRRAACLLVAFAAGPGLLVNGLLKGFWGRARPVNIETFGGDAPFAAAWRFSDGCATNCSFTSGEAASAAWTAMAALALMPRVWRPTAGLAVIVYTLALSMNRIAFGGHFLSDVVLSWLLTLLATILTVRLMRAAPAASFAFAGPRPLAVA